MTTATILGRASRAVDQIDAEAKQLDPRKVLLTLAMVVPFVLGWLVGMTVRALWATFAWIWTAGVVGFRAARPVRDKPS
jgi:hypothetical protein